MITHKVWVFQTAFECQWAWSSTYLVELSNNLLNVRIWISPIQHSYSDHLCLMQILGRSAQMTSAEMKVFPVSLNSDSGNWALITLETITSHCFTVSHSFSSLGNTCWANIAVHSSLLWFLCKWPSTSCVPLRCYGNMYVHHLRSSASLNDTPSSIQGRRFRYWKEIEHTEGTTWCDPDTTSSAVT